jgi:proline iminopeptidase
MSMDLFPALTCRHSGYLDQDHGHRIYWEESGNPNGPAVVFLHGGPGSGTAPVQRRFFDPHHYRIILFDQRGCGQSTPLGETAANSTADLIADMEALRQLLDISEWLIFGGSWGSTLALAYGQAHPQRCSGFILRGIFLGRSCDVDWFMRHMGLFFPDAGKAFKNFLPADEQNDLLGHYHRRLSDADPAVHMPAAHAWNNYELACSLLRPRNKQVADDLNDKRALSTARLEAHYFVNQLFLEPNQLLENMHKIKDLPAIIVQGRYDVICPPQAAGELADAWPQARLTIVDDAGHSALEPGIRAALVAATEWFKKARP